jgi:predicted metal-dependent HD superfamily phosphohydrolase
MANNPLFQNPDAVFTQLCQKYTNDLALIEKLGLVLQKAYTHRSRYYHNLAHIEHVYQQLLPLQADIQDWDSLAFAVFYHDAVYNVIKKNNEAQSAVLAEKHLIQIDFPADKIALVKAHIIATQYHTFSTHPDTNFLTDADLSILGSPWDTYLEYTKQIRAEYGIYPDLLYNPGRKKVLKHFLEMPSIYKTPPFQALYEAQAKANLSRELGLT